MSKMLYKAGGHTNVWGRTMHAEVVSSERVEEYLARGWYANPKDVPVKAPEPLPDAATTSLTGGDATPVDMGDVSDGYHTFNELYAHRVRLFSTLMNAYPHLSWWSHVHSDGEHYDGWILAGIDTPAGSISYHLPETEIKFLPAGTELEIGKEWDGHEAADVLDRLPSLRPVVTEQHEQPVDGASGVAGGKENDTPKKRGRPTKVITDETSN